MRQVVRCGIMTGCVVVGVLLVAGCGGGDKSTGPSTLSAEAQFDSLSAHLDFQPSSSGDDIVSMMLSQLSTSYWDGVDASDFSSAGGGLLAPMFSPHATAAAVTDTSFTFTYDAIGGWWHITYHESWTLFSVNYDGVFTDSVRFENEAGEPQSVPDEVSTYRIIQGGSIDVAVTPTAGNYLFGLTSDLRTDVLGLNTTTVTIDGDGSIALNANATGDQTSAEMSALMQTSWDNVVASNPGTSDVCPLSGSITGSFNLDLDVHDGTDHYQANGDWGIDIDFSGGGNTTVNVHSGDFQREFSGNVCSK